MKYDLLILRAVVTISVPFAIAGYAGAWNIIMFYTILFLVIGTVANLDAERFRKVVTKVPSWVATWRRCLWGMLIFVSAYFGYWSLLTAQILASSLEEIFLETVDVN